MMEINAIHNQFHQTLRQFIRSRVKHTDDAEDILQETFIKLSLNLQALKNTEKLQSWIFTIARNAITDYYRKKINFRAMLRYTNTSAKPLPKKRNPIPQKV